jgi:hypothetical protein
VFPFSTAGLYSLVDSGTGRNSFSVQLNSNPFSINCLPTLGGGGLFGGSNCVNGNLGTVQITYQADPGPWFDPFGWFSASALCIWHVDDTAQNYSNSCVNIPSPFGNNPWVPGAVVQIIGGEANQNVWVQGLCAMGFGFISVFRPRRTGPVRAVLERRLITVLVARSQRIAAGLWQRFNGDISSRSNDGNDAGNGFLHSPGVVCDSISSIPGGWIGIQPFARRLDSMPGSVVPRVKHGTTGNIRARPGLHAGDEQSDSADCSCCGDYPGVFRRDVLV